MLKGQTTISNIVPFPKRLDSVALEKTLRHLEKTLPYLRRHIAEVATNPDKLHSDQAKASLDGFAMGVDYLRFYLKDLP